VITLPNRIALGAGVLLVAATAAAIAVGSGGMHHFDPALTGYALGSLMAAFAVGYRFSVWAQRPPSRMYFKRGLELLFTRAKPRASVPVAQARSEGVKAPILPIGAGTLGVALARNFVAQEFIRRRGGLRWIMHLCLSGGCTLAFAITIPLVFGWIHFEPLDGDAEMYRVIALGLQVDSFSVHSIKALVMFNLLNISAVLVLVGLVLAAWRRITDSGERATQTFAEDILPLILIFAVTATGLALTVSYKFLAGRGHGLWAIVHMVSVVALLLYIPFGKLFHIFQRTCSLAVSRYKKVGASGRRAHCIRCGEDFASAMHVDDLKTVLDELGFNYRFAGAHGEVHYQDVCPACRRGLLALNQGRTIGR
jgi:NNP family nitrate/nitrite transporter-like MFS transporter